MMTEHQIETAVDAITAVITGHEAYDPTNATMQNSLDFLMGIRDEVTTLIDGLRTDMKNDDDEDGL